MAAAARAVLQSAGFTGAIDVAEVRALAAAQPGAAFALFAEFTGGAGAPHRRAENIGARVAHELLEDIASGATIDRPASNQIIPFADLAEGTSTFRVPSSPSTPRPADG